MSNNNYPSLILISKIFKIFGWIHILISIACLVYFFVAWDYYALALVIGILFFGIVCFAFAEGIILLVDIEYNTRKRNNSNFMAESFQSERPATNNENSSDDFRKKYHDMQKERLGNVAKD